MNMLPDINLTHLRYFYNSALSRSLSAAARENYVSQSAISQAIFKLEQALQVQLTTHQRQGFKLTEEGRVLFEETKKIFSSVDNLKDRLNELKGEIGGEVKFVCTNALAQFYLPSVYLKMRKQYPNVHLKFHRGSLSFIHEALKQEKVSLGLAIDAPEFFCYEKKILCKGYYRLYQTKEQKKGSGILVDHLENPEVIALRKNYFERYKKELVIEEALSGWGIVASFVKKGYGTGFLPDFILKGSSGLKEVKLDLPKMEYEICAFKIKGSQLTRAEQAFWDFLSPQKIQRTR